MQFAAFLSSYLFRTEPQADQRDYTSIGIRN